MKMDVGDFMEHLQGDFQQDIIIQVCTYKLSRLIVHQDLGILYLSMPLFLQLTQKRVGDQLNSSHHVVTEKSMHRSQRTLWIKRIWVHSA